MVYAQINTHVFLFFYFQNLKNQIMTTNLWVEQVSHINFFIHIKSMETNVFLTAEYRNLAILLIYSQMDLSDTFWYFCSDVYYQI